jgi:hypothetical protein
MIYIKISSIIISELDLDDINNIKYSTIVKIGYSEDDTTIINRNNSYRTENPGIIDYKYIQGGTKEDEN